MADGKTRPDEYLTIEEAASLLRITPGTLTNHITLGKFTREHGLRAFFGRRLIDHEALKAAMAAGKFDRVKADGKHQR